MTTRPCRCGHDNSNHAIYMAAIGNGAQARWVTARGGCVLCPCPEYRPTETQETQTLRGIETP